MGYLDNTSVVVDAILTKKGRELLSRQDGSFNITQFATNWTSIISSMITAIILAKQLSA